MCSKKTNKLHRNDRTNEGILAFISKCDANIFLQIDRPTDYLFATHSFAHQQLSPSSNIPNDTLRYATLNTTQYKRRNYYHVLTYITRHTPKSMDGSQGWTVPEPTRCLSILSSFPDDFLTLETIELKIELNTP